MCLILFAVNEHPRYTLVLAANRDEFFDRPTLYAHPWEDHREIIAGRDQKGGGTWLGITRKGRFAAVTNYREPGSSMTDALSRGTLTVDFLTENSAPEIYLDKIKNKNQLYNGYNLLISDTPGTLFHYSNITSKTSVIRSGIHGLSNHLLDTPWPKVKKGIEALSNIMAGEMTGTEKLRELMLDRQPAPSGQLPDTGIDPQLESALSPAFINIPGYGSRSTTIVLIGKDGHAVFEEYAYDEKGNEKNKSRFSFYINR